MALGKLKPNQFVGYPVTPQPQLREAGAATPAVASPARALHDLLSESVRAEALAVKWSHRRRLAFIVASASGLWMALIGGGYGVAHLVA